MKTIKLIVYIGLGKKIVIECDYFEYSFERGILHCYDDEKNEVIAEFFDPLGYEIL